MQECKICLRPFCQWDGVIKDNFLYIRRPDGNLVSTYENEEYYEWLILEALGRRVLIGLNDKWGFADIDTGHMVVKPIWDFAGEFFSGFAIVSIGCETMTCDDINNGRFPAGGKYGCIDLLGQVAVPVIYDGIRRGNSLRHDGFDFSDKYMVAEKNGFEGVIDFCNKEILPFVYSAVIPIDNKSFLCKQADDNGYCLLHNNNIVFSDAEVIYKAKDVSNNNGCKVYFIARKRRKFAVFCNDGRMISDFTLPFRDAQNIVVKLNGSWKFQHWL